ncbi:CsbD family protein [Arthrobacter cryoconiti]|uniref:CsbD family protein n=1 Tax=Arthrobacter cryoconiti TaxID=748907 RepID=A0ABV8QZ71_9MICC|nr:CsbD family protein [Arthrobacter cryoconiti]MCC9067682.1 CsbD family protein [Arthrobacter cryoconiti]
MGLHEKLNNSAEEGIGSAKEGAGKLLGDSELENEGRADQVSAKAKQAGEKIKDAAHKVSEDIKDAADKLKDGFTK